MTERKFTIELRQSPVPYANARHYFWVLKDHEGNVVQELHGLPSNPNDGRDEGIKPRYQVLRGHIYGMDAKDGDTRLTK